MWFLQRGIGRRQDEDVKYPPSTWGIDRTDTDVVDPDPEDWMPISKAAAKETQGKIPRRGTIRHQSDDHDSDCEILEVLDPTPLQFTFPLASTSAEDAVDFPPLKVAGRAASTG